MPRTRRFEFPGALAHIMARGLNGMPIFNDDADREFFLHCLSTNLKRTGYECHAWALQNNHYHLLLRTSDLPMSRVMRPLNGSYGHWYNKKYDRRGYLFQDRFKSILCQDLEYTRQLVRYIHLNPLRAGQVRTLRELSKWKWCGHGLLLGVAGAPGRDFQNRDEVIRRFGSTRTTALRGYLSFLQEAIDQDGPEKAGLITEALAGDAVGSENGLPAIVGNPEFVRDAIEKNKERIRLCRRLELDPSALERLAVEICQSHKIPRKELEKRGRQNARSRARKEFCIRAHREFGASVTAIARMLNLTLPPVSIILRSEGE